MQINHFIIVPAQGRVEEEVKVLAEERFGYTWGFQVPEISPVLSRNLQLSSTSNRKVLTHSSPFSLPYHKMALPKYRS